MSVTRSMDQRQLLVRRSKSQLLDHRIADGPEAAVRALLAVQAQDRSAWRLALRARVEGITAGDIDASLSERRSLLVAWLNRGTLHLVCSEDYPWLLALTAPTRVAANRRRLAQEGLSPDDVDRGIACIERSLADEGPLLRAQLRERLAAKGIRTDGQATVHLLFAAVTRGVAVLGPVLPGGHAFAHARDWLDGEQRAPSAEGREHALAELARRYLNGHAPATDADLAKWAGLPLRDVRIGLRSIGSELIELEGGLLELAARGSASGADGATDAASEATESESQSAAESAAEPSADRARAIRLPPRLLPAFDPCLLGWTEREPFVRRANESRVIPEGGGLFRPIATVDGVAAATWSIRRQGVRVAIRVDPFDPLDSEARTALRAEAEDVARFEGRTLVAIEGLETVVPDPARSTD